MRILIAALVCLLGAPAAAQTDSTSASPEVARASTMLAAVWRPVTGAITQAALVSACRGAREEMEAVEAALPAELTTDSLARVRTFHSLIIVPTAENPASAFFFAGPELPWFPSGLGAISVVSEPEGFLAVHDASDHDVALQIGHAGDTRMLRVRTPGATTLTTFVGCTATTPR